MMAPEEGEIIEESGECVAPTTVELEDPETRNDELNLEDEASKQINVLVGSDTEDNDPEVGQFPGGQDDTAIKPNNTTFEPNTNTPIRPISMIPLPGGDDSPLLIN